MTTGGKYVMTNSTAIIARRKGHTSAMVSLRLAPSTRDEVKSVSPKGGVSIPIARFVVRIIPKCTRSIWSASRIGRRRGTMMT